MLGKPRILITGGAGFIGTNVADAYLQSGHEVTLYDNLSRAGVEENLRWIQEQYGERVRFEHKDIRDAAEINRSVARADVVFHFAAQVAVTTSLVNPVFDSSVNLQGTLNVLEAARTSGHRPTVIFTSTNKVYGALPGVDLVRLPTRYKPADRSLAGKGVSEQTPLDFHSPYGCSKGSADQYVIDYGRCFQFPTVVFRMSCICGAHQYGTEDQGWVAHFIRKVLANEKITIYGDGKQVRDVLCVSDLVRAFQAAASKPVPLQHRAYNIGGGPKNATSILELLNLIQAASGNRAKLEYSEMRTGDQLWYVTDFTAFHKVTGWKPEMTVQQSVDQIVGWLSRSEAILPVDSKERSVAACAMP